MGNILNQNSAFPAACGGASEQIKNRLYSLRSKIPRPLCGGELQFSKLQIQSLFGKGKIHVSHMAQGSGIKVYRATEGSVKENLNLAKSGLLPEFESEHTCAGHGIMGKCVH
ncbi:MAG: hypothetical protein KKD92_02725 [Proteobacteria bacterium]|nr:hypothetical protein [Pseudomonadota bacterium]